MGLVRPRREVVITHIAMGRVRRDDSEMLLAGPTCGHSGTTVSGQQRRLGSCLGHEPSHGLQLCPGSTSRLPACAPD